MKSNKYEPRICVICGKEYIPGRKDQRTCGSDECMKERQKLNRLEYCKRNYGRVLAHNRNYNRRRREMEKRKRVETKGDTIIAIGYADRQMEATLKMAGRVKTEL